MSERGAMDETHDDARYCELADRRALDEPLAPDELEFLLAHDAGGPAYEAERALWASLAALDQPAPLDDEDRARAARVIASYRAGRSGRSRRLGASVGALALAAAAAIALWLSPHPELAAPLRVTEGALLQRDGSAGARWQRAEVGQAVAVGDHLSVEEGIDIDRACVGQLALRVCAEPGAALAIVGDRQLTIDRGALELDGAATVRTAHGVLDSDGGALRIEATADRGPVIVEVTRGPVTLTTPHTVEVLAAGDRRVLGALVEVIEEPPRGESHVLKDIPEATGTEPPAVEEPAIEAPDEGHAPRQSASEMLAAARVLRGEGRARKAVDAYRALQKIYPKSQEAHASAVSLGQLYLELGRHRRAARAFERYLGRGGPLAEEAHWGRIQALDKLGDVDGRARALAAFTAAYPSSVYLARARALEDGE